MDDVFSSDHMLGNWNAGITKAGYGQGTCCRGHDGKPAWRKTPEQLHGSGQGSYAFFVINLHLFHDEVFFFGIQLWRQYADGFNATSTMCPACDIIRVKFVNSRPTAPHPFHGRSRVHEHAVHVEENRFGGEDHFPE